MSLSNKLIVAFTLIVSATLIAAWLSFLAVSNLQNTLDHTFEHPFVALSKARAVEPRIVEVQRIVDRSLVAANFKADDHQALATIRKALIADLAEVIERSRSPLATKASRALVIGIEQVIADFSAIHRGEIGRLDRLVGGVEELLQQSGILVKTVLDEAEAFHRQAQEEAERRLLTVWGALALTCIVALLLFVILRKTVVRPLRVAIEALEELADGAGSVHLPDTVWGEVGRLSRVLRTLFERHQRNEQAREEHYRARIESEMRRAEELRYERNRAEAANRAKSEFLANMSHELRTPLNAILGFSELISAGREDQVNAHYREFAGHIVTSGRHLLDLINDLLDTAKIEAGEMELNREDVPLLTEIEEMTWLMQPQADAKHLTLRRDEGRFTPDCLAHVDRRAFRQILLNLLSNAVKFSRENGAVTIRVICDAPDLIVEVEDEGIGIAPQDIDRVFERFEQVEESLRRDHGGTGIGLPLSRALAELHEGTLTLHSTEDEGTTARLHLPDCLRQREESSERANATGAAGPAARPDERIPPPGTGADAAVAQGLRILLAEDHPVNRALMQQVLLRLGHHCVMVENGKQAVAAFLREPFDLILMDMQMPEMDGLEATRRIRELEADKSTAIPIIAVTANALPEHRDACLGAGMDTHLPKPITRDSLANAIDDLLGARAEAAADSGDRAKAPARRERLLDLPVFEGLLSQTDRASMEMVLEHLSGECDQRLPQIDACLENGRFDDLAAAVQPLDSAFVSLGAVAVHRSAMLIEQALDEGDEEALRSELPTFVELCRRTLKTCAQLLKGRSETIAEATGFRARAAP